MIWKPHVTVAAVIENGGRFLLVEERDCGRRVYNQPAGHLEDGESLCAAVVRETLEETAWHFQPAAVVGIYRWRHSARDDTYLRVTFSGSCRYHETGLALDAEIERTVWLGVDEIRRQPQNLRSPMVLRSIDDYLSGISYPLAILADID